MTVNNSLLTAITRLECIDDGLYFARYFMKDRLGSKMIISPHHRAIQSALEKTISGHITRLIVTLPPGYTKTELASINYMARGLAINPRSKFLHLSYSHALALLNSATARQIMKSEKFQNLWQIGTKDDTDSKGMWWTHDGGGVYATSSAGQVTGFRAGHMEHSEDNFTGALIIDDPVKPDDAYSTVMREGVNNRFNETIASRLAVESVPIIVIMQRIHANDLAGYLLKGGSGEKWHHLNLPVIIDNNEKYPEEYTHGIEIDHGLSDGWLWPVKHNDKHAAALKSHRRKFAAQYMQNPTKGNEETALWNDRLIGLTQNREIPYAVNRTIISIDPATTNKETSDEHGIIVASSFDTGSSDETIYRVDADYTKRGSPLDWAKAAIAAVEIHDADAIIIETNQGGDMCESNLRNAGYDGRIIRVHAKKGKFLRAEPVVALYEQGFIAHASGLSAMELEMMDFDPVEQQSNGKSPNRVDACVYAISELAGLNGSMSELLKLSMS